MILIDVICESSAVSESEVQSWCVAQQRQFDAHGHLWNIEVSIQYVPPLHQTRPGSMWHYIRDRSPEPGALAFHNLEGNPNAYTFILDAQDDGVPPSLPFSHENWEGSVDPLITRTTQYVQAGITWETSIECADCCEDKKFAVKWEGLNGEMVLLTAIALPSYFDPEGKAPYTEPPIPEIDAPFQLGYGGYSSRREVAPNSSDYQQVYAMGARTPMQRKKWYSRTLRRFNAATDQILPAE